MIPSWQTNILINYLYICLCSIKKKYNFVTQNFGKSEVGMYWLKLFSVSIVNDLPYWNFLRYFISKIENIDIVIYPLMLILWDTNKGKKIGKFYLKIEYFKMFCINTDVYENWSKYPIHAIFCYLLLHALFKY